MKGLSASCSLRTLATCFAASTALAVLGAGPAWALMPNSTVPFARDLAVGHPSRFLILAQATENGENNGVEGERKGIGEEQKGVREEEAACSRRSSIDFDVKPAVPSFHGICVLMGSESSGETSQMSQNHPAEPHQVFPGRAGGRDGS